MHDDELPDITEEEWDSGLVAAFADEDEGSDASDLRGTAVLERSRIILAGLEEAGAAEEVDPETAGRRWGRYVIAGELARGGVGVIYRARDLHLGRDVAIKVLKAAYVGHAGLLERFVEEAQIGAQLQHPGVVPVYDFGLDDADRPFFAMKLVLGKTLEELLSERTSMEEERERFLEILLGMARTLAHAHARGVVHRDLKPANVMVGRFGEVQIMDWGFAKVLGRDEQRGDDDLMTVRADESSSSVPGSVLGTPPYMAPEQAAGEVDRLDARTDVFALGAILCHVLTGRPPYGRHLEGDVLAQAREARLADAHARLDLCDADPELVSITRTCLEVAPDGRPAHAGALVERLEEWREGVRERAHAARLAEAQARGRAEHERRARRLTLMVGILVLALVAIGAAVWISRVAERQRVIGAVERSLDQAVSFIEAEEWEAARGAWEYAHELSADVDLEGRLVDRLDSVQNDVARGALVAEVASALVTTRSHGDYEEAEVDYAEAFARIGVRPDDDSPTFAAGVLDRFGTVFRRDAARALDDWSERRRETARPWRALLEVAMEVDYDAHRQALRRAAIKEDAKAVGEIADALRDCDDPTTLDLLADALWWTGESGRALVRLRQACHGFPGDFWLNLNLARRLGEALPDAIEEAHRHIVAALTLDPENRAVRMTLARLRAGRGEVDEAIESLLQEVRRRPDPEMHLALAELYAQKSDESTAREHLTKADRMLGGPRGRFGRRFDEIARRLGPEGRRGGPRGGPRGGRDRGPRFLVRYDPVALARHRSIIAEKRGTARDYSTVGRMLFGIADHAGALEPLRDAQLLEGRGPSGTLDALLNTLLELGRYEEVEEAFKEERAPLESPLGRVARLAGRFKALAPAVKAWKDGDPPLDGDALDCFQVARHVGRPTLATHIAIRAVEPRFRRRPIIRTVIATAVLSWNGEEKDAAVEAATRFEHLRFATELFELFLEKAVERPDGLHIELHNWRHDVRFVTVREPERLAELPSDLRARWTVIWRRMSELAEQAR